MNKPARDTDYLADIQIAIGKIRRYTSSLSREAFLSNELVQDAVLRNLSIVGEAVTQLSKEFTSQHLGIPWHSIAGMRHRLIHAYNGVNLNLVWNTVQETLPDFSSKISVIQHSLASPSPTRQP